MLVSQLRELLRRLIHRDDEVVYEDQGGFLGFLRLEGVDHFLSRLLEWLDAGFHPFLNAENVDAQLGAHQVAEFPDGQRKCRLFERRHHLPARKETQIAARLGGAFVLRMFGRRGCKVGTAAQVVEHALGEAAHPFLALRRGVLGQPEQNVPGARLVIPDKGFGIAVVISVDVVVGKIPRHLEGFRGYREVANLAPLRFAVGLLVSFIVSLHLFVADGGLGLEQAWDERHVAHVHLLVLTAVGLFGFSIGDPGALLHQGEDLGLHQAAALFVLELLHGYGGHHTGQGGAVAVGVESPLRVLKTGLAGDVGIKLRVSDLQAVFFGHAQEQGAADDLFDGHLAEVEVLAQVHVGLVAENLPVLSIQGILGALEFSRLDPLTPQRGHFRARRAGTTGLHAPGIENCYHESKDDCPQHAFDHPCLGLAHLF